MSRNFKTCQKSRIQYIYYTSEGTKIIITPSEDGITEADIELLHSMDDWEVDEQRRYEYRTTATTYTPKKKMKKTTSIAISNKDVDPNNPCPTDDNEKEDSIKKEPESQMKSDNVIRMKKMADPFVDHDSNPLLILLDELDEAEHEERLKALMNEMDNLTPAQRELYDKVYVQRRTNTDIAAEEGVTEAAIRNRLKKMHARLRKILS